MLRFVAGTALLLVGCSNELLHGLDERGANEVVAALERGGIAADKASDDRPGQWKVSVPRAAGGRAAALLEERSLPRKGGKGLGEAFAEAGLLPSPGAERARLAAATAVELERALEALPHVAAARVLLALPESDPLRGDGSRPRASASVVMRTRGAPPLTSDEIKRLVARGVDGLQAADVNVVMAAEDEAQAGAPVFAHVGPLAVAPQSRDLAVAFALLALAAILGLGAAVVVLAGRLRSR